MPKKRQPNRPDGILSVVEKWIEEAWGQYIAFALASPAGHGDYDEERVWIGLGPRLVRKRRPEDDAPPKPSPLPSEWESWTRDIVACCHEHGIRHFNVGLVGRRVLQYHAWKADDPTFVLLENGLGELGCSISAARSELARLPEILVREYEAQQQLARLSVQAKAGGALAKAAGIKKKHPSWTLDQIAKAANCRRDYLSRNHFLDMWEESNRRSARRMGGSTQTPK